MKFSRIPTRAQYLIEFFEEGLHSLGAICERSWHDRLDVLAEADAARLWRDDDETDWVVGMSTGGPSGVEIMRRFESQSSAEEFLAGLQCKSS